MSRHPQLNGYIYDVIMSLKEYLEKVIYSIFKKLYLCSFIYINTVKLKYLIYLYIKQLFKLNVILLL